MKKRMSKSLLSVLLISCIFCIHCGGDKNPVAPASEFDGLWRSAGYGYIFEVDAGQFTWYEVTSVSLIEFAQSNLNGDKVTGSASTILGNFTVTLTLSLSGDILTVNFDYPYPPKSITFNRIHSLPERSATTRDPEKNFEVLWHTFEDQYAFFGLRSVDWNAQYQIFRPQVNANTTDAQLFDIFSSLLTPLEDFHVNVGGNIGFFSAEVPHPLENRIDEIGQIIIGTYLNGNYNTEANGKLLYGKLTDAIGYLNILEMEFFSTDNGFSAQENELNNGLDKIIQQFKDLDALVIDVRFNTGGIDVFSLIIASRFADQKRFAYARQARNGGYADFTPLQEIFVEPAGALQFTKNIVLLTSGFTASGAETFTLSLMPLPHVTRIGEPTKGGLSDMLLRKLPNGWGFTLSNERYFSHEMVNYEKVGIPPDIEIFMSEADLAAGKDSILEAALQVLQGN